MPSTQYSNGQQVIQADLNAASSRLQIELYDRMLYELMGRQQNVFFSNGFLASYVNSVTSQVAAGNGVYYDSSQVDPQPKTRMLNNAAAANVTHATPHPTLSRIDLIYATPAIAGILTQNRNYKDPMSGVISTASFVVEIDWVTTLGVVTGVPATVPLVPATPAGSLAIAQVFVTASSGIAGAGAYTDARPVFQTANSSKNVRKVVGSTTLQVTDDIVSVDASGGAANCTLPAVSVLFQTPLTRLIKVMKSDSSANGITLVGTINGLVNPVLQDQYDAVDIWTDGTSYYFG